METEHDLGVYLFHQGTNYQAYDMMGVHFLENKVVFRVWAPHAERIFVVGDFNDWENTLPMTRITEGGVWEASILKERVLEGSCYKYKIVFCGREFFKADPYAFASERPSATASIVTSLEGYDWRDEGWLEYRASRQKTKHSEPMNVYELHLGSWKRHKDGSYYSYSELACELSTYVKQMGYTHVELMPVMEHPFDGS